jgi:hypothetical protein
MRKKVDAVTLKDLEGGENFTIIQKLQAIEVRVFAATFGTFAATFGTFAATFGTFAATFGTLRRWGDICGNLLS